MRRPPTWLARFARDDAGLTAVEYAILVGLFIVIGSAAVLWLGQRVHKSSGRVAWDIGSTNLSFAFRTSAGIQPVMTMLPASKLSTLPWTLLSLGASVSVIGGIFGWHYLRDYARQARTRRLVRRSLADASRQASLERFLRRTDRTPIVRLKKAGTQLIGRDDPDLHHRIRGRDAALTLWSRHPSAHAASTPDTLPTIPVVG